MASGKGTSVVTDGATLVLINKRVRNLRKKLNRIVHLEDSIAQGKSMNKDQEKLLKSKPTIIAAINELEKFRQPPSVAVDEEITLALQRRHNDNDEDCNKEKKSLDAEQHETEQPALPVDDLASLIYIGSIFDVMLHMRNRGWVYDFLTRDGDSSVSLTDRDLDLMSLLGSLLFSIPVGSSLSHQNALQRCIEHASLWLSKSEQQIVPNSDITYADLRENLTKILGLEYSINPPADDVVAAVARKSLCVEGSVTQCEQKGTHHESYYETQEDQSSVPKPVPEGTHHESCTETHGDQSPVPKPDPEGIHHESCTETHEDQSPVPKPEPEGTHHESCTETHEDQSPVPKPEPEGTHHESSTETEPEDDGILHPGAWLPSDSEERGPWKPRRHCFYSRDFWYTKDWDGDCYFDFDYHYNV